jgi:hypothetical protein
MSKIVSHNLTHGFYWECLSQAMSNAYREELLLSELSLDEQAKMHKIAAQKFENAALCLVAEGYCRTTAEARDYLDSDYGRHLHGHMQRFTKDSNLAHVPFDMLMQYLPHKPAPRTQCRHARLQAALAV